MWLELGHTIALYESSEIDAECANETKFTFHVHLFTYFIEHDYHHLRRGGDSFQRHSVKVCLCECEWCGCLGTSNKLN